MTQNTADCIQNVVTENHTEVEYNAIADIQNITMLEMERKEGRFSYMTACSKNVDILTIIQKVNMSLICD